MTEFVFTNKAVTVLSAPLGSAATSLVLGLGQGALFPVTGIGQGFPVVFEDRRLGLYEVCLCTSRVGDQLNLNRAQEGTLAQSWAAGTQVSLRVTAGVMNDLSTRVTATEDIVASEAIDLLVNGSFVNNEAPIFKDGAWGKFTVSGFSRGFLVATTAGAFQALVGLVIGTNVQAQNAKLQAMANLTAVADRLAYFTGASTMALAVFTAFGRSLVAAADAATARAILGLGALATKSTVSTGDLASNEQMNANNVLVATAGANAGSIGAYALLELTSSGSITVGGAYAGSSLRWSGFYPDSTSQDLKSGGLDGVVNFGTWRAMGGTNSSPGSSYRPATLFLRIA